MSRLVIPSKVYIRGKWWPVVRGVDLDGGNFPGHPKSQEALGFYGCIKDETIYLSHKVFGKRIERVTLLHELIHACSSTGILSAAKEEQFVEDVDDPLLKALEKLDWE